MTNNKPNVQIHWSMHLWLFIINKNIRFIITISISGGGVNILGSTTKQHSSSWAVYVSYSSSSSLSNYKVSTGITTGGTLSGSHWVMPLTRLTIWGRKELLERFKISSIDVWPVVAGHAWPLFLPDRLHCHFRWCWQRQSDVSFANTMFKLGLVHKTR